MQKEGRVIITYLIKDPKYKSFYREYFLPVLSVVDLQYLSWNSVRSATGHKGVTG